MWAELLAEHVGELEQGPLEGVLQLQGPEALVQSRGPFLGHYAAEAVHGALVLRDDGRDRAARVQVVHDRPGALQVQPVQSTGEWVSRCTFFVDVSWTCAVEQNSSYRGGKCSE